ncbi:MAG: ABC transporter [Dehalococcoidia bacterium]|jgi:hypothetical protein
MEYQLVIQFPAEKIEDFESLVKFEDSLIKIIGTSAEVDGHDFGSGEANIFIITPNPASTFALIKKKLASNGMLKQCLVAHRELQGEKYSVIWPEGFSGKFKVK